MSTDTEAVGTQDARPPDEAHPDEAGRAELASAEVEWDDIDKASHQAHALLRDLAESALLSELLAEASQELARRLEEVAGTERVRLLSPADRDWVLEVLLDADSAPPEPAAPPAEYSVLSLRGGFGFTIYHSSDAGEPVPSVVRFEQPGSCYTSSATLVQVLDTTGDTVALVLRRWTARPAGTPTDAEPERVSAALNRLLAAGMLR